MPVGSLVEIHGQQYPFEQQRPEYLVIIFCALSKQILRLVTPHFDFDQCSAVKSLYSQFFNIQFSEL